MLEFFNKNIKPLADELDEAMKERESTGTQIQRTYKMLQRAGKHGVANYEFANVGILRYGSTILELRKEGYSITVERQHLPNGKATQTWKYFLLEEK